MTLSSAGEKVMLTLKGTPMLMVLLIVVLVNTTMIGYLTYASAQIRSAERRELVDALKLAIQRCDPPRQ
jgi:type II secretory pathway component PulK